MGFFDILKRGDDPYAGSAVADVLDQGKTVHRAPFEIPATEYAAGTSVWTLSPIRGKIRKVVTVVNTLTAGAGAITLELETVAVAGLSVVIADASAVGTIDSDDSVTGDGTEIVAKDAAIEIVSDGTPTAGAIRGYVEIEPYDA